MGYEVPFGYEEAIGYMFGSEIRDKDGVAATVRDCNSLQFLFVVILSIGLVRRNCDSLTRER